MWLDESVGCEHSLNIRSVHRILYVGLLGTVNSFRLHASTAQNTKGARLKVIRAPKKLR